MRGQYYKELSDSLKLNLAWPMNIWQTIPAPVFTLSSPMSQITETSPDVPSEPGVWGEDSWREYKEEKSVCW